MAVAAFGITVIEYGAEKGTVPPSKSVVDEVISDQRTQIFKMHAVFQCDGLRDARTLFN
jgi:hypothetical protein